MTLKERRQAAGLTQVKLAEKIGVTQSAIVQWETERTKPGITSLMAMAKLYGCSVEQLAADANVITK